MLRVEMSAASFVGWDVEKFRGNVRNTRFNFIDWKLLLFILAGQIDVGHRSMNSLEQVESVLVL